MVRHLLFRNFNPYFKPLLRAGVYGYGYKYQTTWKGMKMLNLENSYRITLTTAQGKKLVQYIQAENMDKAAKLARLTFEAGFYKFMEGFEAQKACDKTKLNERLRFGFKGGWNTLDCHGLTIFESMAKARQCFGAMQDITEITNASAAGL